jgi:hypothetical protein
MKFEKFKGLIQDATKDWKKQRVAEIKNARAIERRFKSPPRLSRKDLVERYIEQAYLKASGEGRYSVNARQIMYAIRPLVLEHDPEHDVTAFAKQFLGSLLDEYLTKRKPSWADKVDRDARGNFHEPHTDRSVALGTAEVDRYLGEVAKHKVGAVRLGDHVIEGHERAGSAEAGRRDLRPVSHPAVRAARLRQVRLLDLRHDRHR